MISKIHHVGIVVEKLQAAYEFYRDTLGLPVIREAELPDQGVRAALLAAGESEVELLEPVVAAGTGVARFLAKRGEGLHHVCFETDDVGAALRELSAKGVALIDPVPRPGLAGLIAFIHPAACAGVLVELATPSGVTPATPSPVRLKRLVIGAEDPTATARLFQRLFTLSPLMNSGPRVMLSIGRSALLIVPREEVGGTEGLVALSMLSEELEALIRRLEEAGAGMLKGTSEVTVEPRSTHGVHLHISRYE